MCRSEWKGIKKRHWTPSFRFSFCNPQEWLTACEVLEWCLASGGTNDYHDLSKCQQATMGEDFPIITVSQELQTSLISD